MEDAVKYLAEIVEYLVGGVLVAAALLLSVGLSIDGSVGRLQDEVRDMPQGGSLGFGLVALALVYALGIVCEGVSRIMTEPGLTFVTAKHPYIDALVEKHHRAEHASWMRRTARAKKVREKLRYQVKKGDSGLAAAIADQLKRMRIERIYLLASLIALVGALRADHVRGSVVLAFVATTVIGLVLVGVRFGRFVNTIVTQFETLELTYDPPRERIQPVRPAARSAGGRP